MAEKKGKQVAEDEKWIPVRIPKWAEERLSKWAKRRDVSKSWLMRRLLLEALENGKDEQDGL